MDIVAMLVEKVKSREQRGRLPFHDNEWVVATAPSRSDYVPELSNKHSLQLSNIAGYFAAIMLCWYFEDRFVPVNPADAQGQKLNRYTKLVGGAWREGRNLRSIRLLAILADEFHSNMGWYLADATSDPNRFQYARSTAQRLGIENDWPELRPAQPIPQRRRAPTGLDANPNFAAKIAGIQIQQTINQNRLNNR